MFTVCTYTPEKNLVNLLGNKSNSDSDSVHQSVLNIVYLPNANDEAFNTL